MDVFGSNNCTRSCELSQKFNLFLDISLSDSPSAPKDASISTTDDGVVVWKVWPGRINELVLSLRNGDDPAKQKKDPNGRDLGIVLRSVEFLRHDADFELTGEDFFSGPKHGVTLEDSFLLPMASCGLFRVRVPSIV